MVDTEQGYFPLLIKLSDTGEEMVVDIPDNLPNGRAFTVLQTNYEE